MPQRYAKYFKYRKRLPHFLCRLPRQAKIPSTRYCDPSVPVILLPDNFAVANNNKQKEYPSYAPSRWIRGIPLSIK
jgi:hypothetical protein